jgi:hypothetical protein
MTGWRRVSRTRIGQASPVIVVLLAGILLALGVLIGVLVTQGNGRGNGQNTPRVEGEEPRRSVQTVAPKPPKPIDDPDRIRETLRPGRTYSIVVKAAIDARAEDKQWWSREVIHLAYVAEMQVDRLIESNDGRRIVELRHFVAARNAKLLCDVEEAEIDLGAPEALVLSVLSYLKPEAGIVVVLTKPIADSVLRFKSQEKARVEAAKTFARVDSLSGKKVRIIYVDGVGVESVEPVDCSLNDDEKAFIEQTAVLSDCYIWDLKKKPGERWKVDGAQLSGLIDPSLRGITEGEIGLVRYADDGPADRRVTQLRIEEGTLTIDKSDQSRRRIGRFTPEGSLRFSQTDKVVESARLTGRFELDEVSTDHILFETSFKSRPTLKIEYSCTVR